MTTPIGDSIPTSTTAASTPAPESSTDSKLDQLIALLTAQAAAAPAAPTTPATPTVSTPVAAPVTAPVATPTEAGDDAPEPVASDPSTVPPVTTAAGTSLVYTLEEDGKALIKSIKADGSEVWQEYGSEAEAFAEHGLLSRLAKLLHL